MSRNNRAEETLSELERFAHSTLDALSAHLAILDETGIIIAVNRAWRRFAAANAASLNGLAEGANYLAVCDAAKAPDAEGAAAFAAGIRAILQGVRDEFVLEYPCHAPDEKRWFIGRVTRFTADGATRLVVAHEDITERRRAEAVLLESEERYRRVSEMIVDFAYSCFKPAGGAFAIDWLVGAVERISGYTADEVRSRGCWKFFVHPADLSIFEDRVIGLNPGDAGECELRIVHKDGTIRWLRALSRVIEEGGDPLFHRLFGTCEDITERKQAEEALQHSEKRYRLLVENTNEAILVIQDGMIRFLNHAASQIIGYPEDELLSRHFTDFIHRDDRSMVLGRHVRRLRGEKPPGRYSFQLVDNDGGTRWVEVGAVLIEWEGRAATLNFVTDVNTRKRAEEALREANQYLNNLINYANAPIIVWDTKYRITRFNRAFEKLTGRTSQEVIGQSLALLFPPDQVDATMSFIQRTQPDEHWETVEIGIQHVDGTIRFVLWNSATICGPDGITLLATIAQGQDITERKRVEEERARLQAQTWQLQKSESLGRMAGAIAHHFNNQLQIVIGNLELAMDHYLPEGKESHAHIISALQASSSASEISGMMLDYLGQTSGDREPLDLCETFRRSLPVLRSAMPKGTVLETDLPCPGPVISANANQMQQVLSNLITNAWESFGEGKGAVRLTVRTVSSSGIPAGQRFPVDWSPQESPYACLEVTDTGCGIADEFTANLFDPFFSSKFTGRGLGLAVALGIVRAHGGMIAVESEQNRGSVFRVFLPAFGEKVSLPPKKPEQAAETGGAATVLLVEDDEMLCALTEEMLKSLGFSVLAAKNGVEAVEVFRRHRDRIRCVLLDLIMPRMDGWETLAALRALRPDLPVIMTSGYDEARGLRVEHPELPQAFLNKPYRMKDLKAALSMAQKSQSG